MIPARFKCLCWLIFLLCSGRGGECRAQVPDPIPPPTPNHTPAREIYIRPNLSPLVWDLSAAKLPQAKSDTLAQSLVLLVRNFPTDKSLTMEWKSRILSVALRLKPSDRDGLVANGQLVRGVSPKPTETDTPVKLDTIVASLLKSSIELFGDQKDKSTATYALGLHLLDIATQLDPSNKQVRDIRLQGAPPLLWRKLVEPAKGNSVSEELPDLRLVAGQLRLILRNQIHRYGQGRPTNQFSSGSVVATAKRIDGPARSSLQLILPSDADAGLESSLPAIKQLLIKRHPQWPGGWRVTMGAVEVKPSGQPSVYLGLGILLDSMISGQEIDENVLVACGLDTGSGETVPLMSLSLLVDFAAGKPEVAPDVLIVSPQSLEAAHDFILLNKERAMDLLQLNLCVAKNFAACMELASVNRPPLLQRNLDRSKSLLAILKAKGVQGLRTPEIQKELNTIAEQNPNLFAIGMLRSLVLGQVPTKLSRAGSINQLQALASPILQVGSDAYPLRRNQNTAGGTHWSKAKSQIDRIRPMLSSAVRPYADALSDLAKSYDTWVSNPPTTSTGWNDLKRSIADQRARLEQARSALFSIKEPGSNRSLEQ